MIDLGAAEAWRGMATTASAPRGAGCVAIGALRLASVVSLVLVLSLGPAAPLGASGMRPAERAAPGSPALRMSGGRLTARIVDVPLDRVIDALAGLTGARIDVDVAAGERVTVEFRDLPVEESLHRLLRGRQLIFVYEQSPRDLVRLVAVRAYDGGESPKHIPRELREDEAVPATRVRAGAVDLSPDRDALALALLTSEDHDRRRRAAETLGRVAGDGVTAALSRGLEDADPDVRESAARALGRTWDESAIEPLASALRDDGDPGVRETAARALGSLWSEGAVEVLARALLSDPLRAVREAAARALGDIGGTDGVWALVAAVRDSRGSVRESVVAALGDIGGASAIEALTEVSMTDRDPWVRAAAAAALEEARGP